MTNNCVTNEPIGCRATLHRRLVDRSNNDIDVRIFTFSHFRNSPYERTMGGRNINTTKSGKFMNPTDQARKEARKKELKKNKKQRLLVRQSVLKNKNPRGLISEMEHLDRMEFDPVNPAPYNIKVLQEKTQESQRNVGTSLSTLRKLSIVLSLSRFGRCRRKNNRMQPNRWTHSWLITRNLEHKRSLISVNRSFRFYSF